MTDILHCQKCYTESRILVTVRVYSDSYYAQGYKKEKWCLRCVQVCDTRENPND